eukprot:Skav225178  [mRNA]  locus=scaffold1095:407029:411564:- [translate_table: standard]
MFSGERLEGRALLDAARFVAKRRAPPCSFDLATLAMARRQAELCDQVEALQVVYDMQDGMGGVTELMMRWAKEEMPGA